MTGKRTIVIASSLAFSLINFRGALIAALIRDGYRVIACAPDRDAEVVRALEALGAEFRLVPMKRTGLNPIQDIRTLFAYVRLLRAERPDLVLAYTQKPIIYAGLATRLVGGSRFFAMVTGLGYVFAEMRRHVWLQYLLVWLYRAAVRRAARLIIFNPDDGEELLRRRIVTHAAQIERVPGSGVDLAHFSERPLPSGPPIFLLVARLLTDKGLREFVSAAEIVRRRHPSARFQLLGPFDDNPAAISRAEVELWQKAGLVDYLGQTRDVRPYLAGCTVFVLPSYREGLPRTVLEAMATGRAIITTDAPGCRETATHGDNGFLVSPRDPQALAEAMLRFCEAPDLAARMGKRSLDMARAMFSTDRINGMLLKLFGDGVAPR